MAYEITKVPKGRGHTYAIDGEECERVTNIVRAIISKGGGFEWFLKTDAIAGFQRLLRENPTADYTTQSPRDLLKWSRPARGPMDRGTAVHAAIEIGDFEPSNFHPDDQGYVKAAAAFHADHELVPEAQELIVGSKQYAYAGTLDWRGSLDGRSVILDWKTSKAAYAEYHLQLAAYEVASVEMGFDPTDAQLIVLLRPDGTYEAVETVADAGDWLCALDWYRALTNVQERVAA